MVVVDDSGRLLEYCVINDDPAGYGALTAFLAERFGGSTAIIIAADNDEYLVGSLLAVSGRLIAFTDEVTADDFAKQLADEEPGAEADQTPERDAEKRAIGLARALQAGALSASVSAAPREYAVLRPLLAAHSAQAVGRHAAAVALREVLRELYPAALRAYPDPASHIALAMLDALPEPGLLTAAAGKGRDVAVTVAARLVADGICDNDTALEAVAALRTAITDTPRRNGVGKQLSVAVAGAVQASVAAVRSADTATDVLIRALTERLGPSPAATTAPTATRRRAAPTALTTSIAQPRPVAPPPQAPEPMKAKPVAPPPVAPAPVSPAAVPVDALDPSMPLPVAASLHSGNGSAGPAGSAGMAGLSRPSWPQSSPPTPPGFEPTPVSGTPTLNAPVPAPIPAPEPALAQAPPPRTVTPAQRSAPAAEKDPLTPFVPLLSNAAINSERAARGLTPAPAPAPSASPADPLPSRDDWPLVNQEDDSQKRVPPPWQTDDLVLPSLRLVEPEPIAEPVRAPASAPPAPAPALRLVEDPLNAPSLMDDGPEPMRIPKPRRAERQAPPPPQPDDTDLLIFASVSSAWFADETGEENTWNSSMDTGWRAAEQASLTPTRGVDTNAGLPQRVPQANLVPGSAEAPQERPLRIVRDANEIAASTSSYFRGWRRGNQETGGYPVGGRPGRESASGWDFSREHEMHEMRDAANYR